MRTDGCSRQRGEQERGGFGRWGEEERMGLPMGINAVTHDLAQIVDASGYVEH